MEGKALAPTKENQSHHRPVHQTATHSGFPSPVALLNGHNDAQEESDASETLGVLSPLTSQMEAVEEEISRLISTRVQLVTQVTQHSLRAGGKRLRPALTILCAQLCGDDHKLPSRRTLTSAAVVELTHTTTLLHDDVVDEAATRRGLESANSLWGNQTSVLVGDYLFAQVFVTLAEPDFVQLITPLALATSRMCAGELQEIEMRHCPDLTQDQYHEIIALKTASLTECACHLGAMAMNAPTQTTELLQKVGHNIGMTFQIIDDVLDLTAHTTRLGKPVGHDLREGDVTLPMLYALEHAEAGQAAQLRTIIETEELSEAQVQRGVEIISKSGAIEHAKNAARHYVDQALQILDQFPQSDANDLLRQITDYVVTRQH